MKGHVYVVRMILIIMEIILTYNMNRLLLVMGRHVLFLRGGLYIDQAISPGHMCHRKCWTTPRGVNDQRILKNRANNPCPNSIFSAIIAYLTCLCLERTTERQEEINFAHQLEAGATTTRQHYWSTFLRRLEYLLGMSSAHRKYFGTDRSHNYRKVFLRIVG
jgi:hypothetical protein